MNLPARFPRPLLFALGLAALGPYGRADSPAAVLPYRFLLVVNDQWKDPASELVEDPGEFSMVCALLSSWGLPFEIYRLDQQRFDAYHILGRTGGARESTIIWDAPGARLEPQESNLLRTLVEKDGVGLVAFGDSVAAPVIAELTGIRRTGAYRSADPLTLSGDDFVIRGVATTEPPPVRFTPLLRNEWKAAGKSPVAGTAVELAPGVRILGRRGDHPALVSRAGAPGGKAVWLDADRPSAQIYRTRWRELLKRALVWVNGYALYAEYPRSVMLSMDDMGAADKTFYPEWHYRTLSQELIHAGMIAPLQRHHAVLTQNVVTGFVDRRTCRVLDPWNLQVADELDPGIVHDYRSTKRGLDDGIEAGVFEIESHGWTHMVPDLDSPPGPFWSAPPKGDVVGLNWYKEFGDYIRQAEIPASVQRLHLRRGIDAIETDFGTRPVSLICGGGYSSHALANNTTRLAAEEGFGLAESENTFATDHDRCVALEPIMPRVQWQYDQPLSPAAMPWSIDAPIFLGFHDRDVALDPSSLGRLLDNLGDGVRYMTFAEYCGYLHAGIHLKSFPGPLTLEVDYDPHYCGFFRAQPSAWVLQLSDEFRAQSNPAAPERRTIRFDPGLGTHDVPVAGPPRLHLGEKKADLEGFIARVARKYIALDPVAPGDENQGDWAAVQRSQMPKTAYWAYTTGATLMALPRAGDITGDPALLAYVEENNRLSADHYAYLRWEQRTFGKIKDNGWWGKLWRLSMLDDCGAMGTEILDTHLRHGAVFTAHERELIDIIGGYVTQRQSRLPDGVFWRPESPDGPTMWADDMFQGVPFLLRWSEYRREPQWLDDAARQLIGYAARLQDRDGLWFHAYFVNEHRPNGFKWGRGNGWVSIALVETLAALPPDHPDYPKVLEIYRRQIQGLKACQAPSGRWYQVLDHPELAWGEETSCTAQFTYALCRGLARGWLGPEYTPMACRALQGLTERIDPDGGIRGVCKSSSIGRDLAYYDHRPKVDNDPHGFGLTLLALTEAWKLAD